MVAARPWPRFARYGSERKGARARAAREREESRKMVAARPWPRFARYGSERKGARARAARKE